MEDTKKKKKLGSRSSKLGLVLSVARIDKIMRDMRAPKRRVGCTASVYATAVVELVMKDVLQAASRLALATNHKQLTNRHVQLAVSQNDELNSLLGDVSIGTRLTIPAPVNFILTKKQQEKRRDQKISTAQKKAQNKV